MKTNKQKLEEANEYIKKLTKVICDIEDKASKLQEAVINNTAHPLILERCQSYEKFIEELYEYITRDNQYNVIQTILLKRAEIKLRKEFN